MQQIKPYLFKYLKIAIFLSIIIGLYQGYNYYYLGINPLKDLYHNSPFMKARELTKINEAKLICLQKGGVWKKKINCGDVRYAPGRSYPQLSDYECYQKYSDAGKTCRSSSQCEGKCRLNDFLIEPLTGFCEDTNEPTCCVDELEDQNQPDFGRCVY